MSASGTPPPFLPPPHSQLPPLASHTVYKKSVVSASMPKPQPQSPVIILHPKTHLGALNRFLSLPGLVLGACRAPSDSALFLSALQRPHRACTTLQAPLHYFSSNMNYLIDLSTNPQFLISCHSGAETWLHLLPSQQVHAAPMMRCSS